MATFKTQFGVGEGKDLFYPNVLTPDLQLSAGSVQDAFRRVFDAIYQINPPVGSRVASSVPSTPGFIDSFTVNLKNNIVILANENWNSSTAGVSWNQHTLTYNGVAYTIIAGGPTTNKYIYWTLSQSGNYQTAATFPDLSATGTADGSTSSALIAIWNSSDGKLYPFWSAKMAVAFIATALIEDLAVTTAKIQNLAVSTAKIALLAVTTAVINDLAVTTAKIDNLAVTNAQINDISASKITTGTLAASVAITLTASDTTAAVLNFGTSAKMFSGVTTNAGVTLIPLTDQTGILWLGTNGSNSKAFGSILIESANTSTSGPITELTAWESTNSKGIMLQLAKSTAVAGDKVSVSIWSSTVRGEYAGPIYEFSLTQFTSSKNIIINVDGGGIGRSTNNGIAFNDSTNLVNIFANGANRLIAGPNGLAVGNAIPAAFFNVGSANQFQMNSVGVVTAYNNIATVGDGTAYEVATNTFVNQTADVASTTMYAVPASGAGLYRVSVYTVITTAATTSSTLPRAYVSWTDQDSNTAVSVYATQTSTTNTIGTVGFQGTLLGVIAIQAKASTNIIITTDSYASVGATPMAFALRTRVERLG